MFNFFFYLVLNVCRIPRIAVFLIILLILGLSLVLGYFFGVPALIQAFVNNSNLDFSSVNIGDAQNDSFTLKASATLSNAGSFSCSVDAMNVDVFYQGAKIGSTSMPKLDIEGGSISIDIEETFTISDVSLFEAYSKELLNVFFKNFFKSLYTYFKKKAKWRSCMDSKRLNNCNCIWNEL